MTVAIEQGATCRGRCPAHATGRRALKTLICLISNYITTIIIIILLLIVFELAYADMPLLPYLYGEECPPDSVQCPPRPLPPKEDKALGMPKKACITLGS